MGDFYHYASRFCSKLINKVCIQKIKELWLGQPANSDSQLSPKVKVRRY